MNAKAIVIAAVLAAVFTVPAYAEWTKTLVGERTVYPCSSCQPRCEQLWKYENTDTGEVKYGTTRESGAC
jgi:hypothetical protein